MMFDLPNMRKRFHDLIRQRDAIRATSAPMRQTRDAIEGEARAQTEVIDAQVRESEAPLAAIKEELSILEGVLKGKAGKAE